MNAAVPRSPRTAAALLLAALLGAAACGDDGPVTPPQGTGTGASSTGADTTSATGTTTPGVDTTDTAGSASGSAGSSSSSAGVDSTGSSSTGDTEGTTGEPVVAGRTTRQLVSAGMRTASRSYTLVHTLGQPSPLQSTHQSPGYRLQGGLAGANGSPP